MVCLVINNLLTSNVPLLQEYLKPWPSLIDLAITQYSKVLVGNFPTKIYELLVMEDNTVWPVEITVNSLYDTLFHINKFIYGIFIF